MKKSLALFCAVFAVFLFVPWVPAGPVVSPGVFDGSVPSQDSTDNDEMQDVIGNKTDTAAAASNTTSIVAVMKEVYSVVSTISSSIFTLTETGGTTLKNGQATDVHIAGHSTYMTGLKLDQCARGLFERFRIHSCLKGIHIDNAASDGNMFYQFDIGDCSHVNGIAIDIDAGNEQHFDTIQFHHNTKNVDDEVGGAGGQGDHHWNNIQAELDVTLEPDNFTGVTVATGGAGDAWTAAPVIVRAQADNSPFKIVATIIEGNATEKFRIRFSADAGSTWFDDISIEGKLNAQKREAKSANTNTDFIFNKGTQIVAEAKSETGGNSTVVWIELQEL